MPSNGHGGRRRGTGRPRGAVGRQDRVLRTSWASVARKHADAALATLAMIMKDNGEPAAVRVRAANDVLDRGYGRPPTQSIEVLTPPSEIPELPTQREIEAELKRRGLPCGHGRTCSLPRPVENDPTATSAGCCCDRRFRSHRRPLWPRRFLRWKGNRANTAP